MELDPEAHAHPHATGHRWLDLALAFGAFAVSVASIAIALQNESAMKRLVLANSWPYIELSHGNASDGKQVIHFDVRNAGIGPARLDKLVVSYAGQPVSSALDLLARCCSDAPHGSMDINLVNGRVFAARDEMSFLAVTRSEANAALWDKLNTERFKVDIGACYSSVFDEHWITYLRHPKPVPAKDCSELQGASYDAALYDAK
jgi:hypothetical protein